MNEWWILFAVFAGGVSGYLLGVRKGEVDVYTAMEQADKLTDGELKRVWDKAAKLAQAMIQQRRQG